MQVQDIFKQLSYGELASLALSEEGAGTILAEEQPKIVSQINTSLTALYSRFMLKRAFLRLEIQEDLDTYVITPENAVSQSTPGQTTPAYIIDSASRPFTGGLIKILAVNREDDLSTTEINEARAFGINTRSENAAAQILSHDTIWFPKPRAGERFLIEYQAGHDEITMTEPLTQNVSMVPVLREALMLRIAAGVYSAMSGEAHVAKSQELFKRYEDLCLLTDLEDLTQETGNDNYDRLRDKGFV